MFCADAETTHPRAAIMYGRARPVRYSRTIVKRRSDHFTLLITQNTLTALDRQVKKVNAAHTRLPSVGFRS